MSAAEAILVRVCIACLVAASAFLPAGPAPASAISADQFVAIAQAGSSVGDEAPKIPAETRQRTVATAVLLLLGIVGAGLILMLLVLLWGVRVRRIARAPLPGQSPVDPLWYLRPKPPRKTRAAGRSPETDITRGASPGGEKSGDNPDDGESAPDSRNENS
jgi:hypothetical protein